MMLNITNESRVFQGPWTTLVKGRGLGSNTQKFDPVKSNNIKQILKVIDESAVTPNPYGVFSDILCHFILDFNNPEILFFQRKELHPRIDAIISALKQVEDPYQYISASSILFECFAKLGLDPHLWINKKIDLAEDALIKLTSLPTTNELECYKSLELHGNLFLGIAHIGQVDKLTQGEINYVDQAFNIANGLEDVWHKGRGIAAFLTVLGLVGLGDYATNAKQNHLKDLVCYMDSSLEDNERVEKRANEYVFSMLLMINCMGVLDELKYLEYKRDWVKVSGELLETLPLGLKAIFTHYCLSTLDNLGLTHKFTNNNKAYLQNIIENLVSSEASELDYMAYTYCVDIAHKLNIVDAIPDFLADKLIENVSTLYDFKNGFTPTYLFYRSGFMRMAYALTALSQMGKIDRLLEKSTVEGKPLVARLITNHLENWDESDDSFTTLNHALIDLSLSQRGLSIDQSVIDKNIVIYKDIQHCNVKYLPQAEKSKISLHAYFPGMNSRRAYANISRDLYTQGNPQVRAIFENASKILAAQTSQATTNLSRFFFEDTLMNGNICEKWNTIGASMTVYNLALFEHLKTSTDEFFISSVGGESYGAIAAAIASKAISFEDGLKLANNTLGIIYKYAHLNDFGKWHIVSLAGHSISHDLQEIKRAFPQGIDIFRWQTLRHEKEEVHVYIHQHIFTEVKLFIEERFASTISLKEFKEPTIEIIHSPKFAPARIDISNFIIDENIVFSKPDIPILANNGTGIASSANEVRNLILDMTNIPMYSAQSFQSFAEIAPTGTDAIVELGYGQKTQSFIYEHGIRQPFFEYFGDEQKLQSTIKNIKKIKHSIEFQRASGACQTSKRLCLV